MCIDSLTEKTCPICGEKFKCYPSDKKRTCGKPECTRQYKIITRSYRVPHPKRYIG
jgi:hypothetical protein